MTARKNKKCLYVLAIAIFIYMFVAVPGAMAAGDSSGGGQSVPLGLDSSSPANGAQNIALTTPIKLLFNKNVVNMTVRDNNQRCFTLYAGNAAVPIDVQMADDQINPELKREVSLVPRQGLQAGITYTVNISKALQAKSGAVLGRDVKIRFTTAAAEKVVPPAPAGEEKKSAETPVTDQLDGTSQTESKAAAEPSEKVSPAETEKKAIQPKTTETSPSESIKQKPPAQTDDRGGNNGWIWPVLIIAVIVLGAGYGYLRKRR